MSASEAVENRRSLSDALRFSLYGEKLCESTAVRVLEEYYSALNSSVLGGPISANLHLSTAIQIAIKQVDVDFFVQFAEALKIRNDPLRRDRWRVADYVFHKVLRGAIRNPNADEGPSKQVDITIGELEKLFENKKGKTNISRIVGELGIRQWVIDRRVKGKWSASTKK